MTIGLSEKINELIKFFYTYKIYIYKCASFFLLLFVIINIYLSNEYHKKYPWRDYGTIVDEYKINTDYGDTLYVSVIYRESYIGIGDNLNLYLETENNNKRSEIFNWYTDLSEINQKINPKEYYKKLSFNCIYDSSQIRCYDFCNNSSVLIKIKSTENFFYTNYIDFNDSVINESEYDYLKIPFAYNKFSTGDFRWVKIFSKYLLHNNNQKTKLALKRYAKGNFTKSELAVNQNNKIILVDMQKFAIEILKMNISIKKEIKE